jgi:hypothetical protein
MGSDRMLGQDGMLSERTGLSGHAGIMPGVMKGDGGRGTGAVASGRDTIPVTPAGARERLPDDASLAAVMRY